MNIYEESYYRMAFRMLLGKVDIKKEMKFLDLVNKLKQDYDDVEINDYVFYNILLKERKEKKNEL